MHSHGTAVLPRTTEVAPAALAGGNMRSQRAARCDIPFAETLPATNAHFPSPPAELDPYPGPDLCPDCRGAAYVADDGSITDMIGWPIPCHCTEYIPRNIKALFATRPLARSRSASLSRIKL
jgi:hypothetical protein